tara:strand:- start:350 stop:784 length:435 start_codon:yes stop_codon:yes gene_type:complete
MRNIFARLFVTATIITCASFSNAFEVSGESFPANFEMTSWTSDSDSSSMTAVGVVEEGYGKVYLNYTFKSNSTNRSKGNFSGSLRSINNDGVMVAATLQGIWKRDGKIVTMHTLDGFSNGDMIYAKGIVDLVKSTLNFTAFRIE